MDSSRQSSGLSSFITLPVTLPSVPSFPRTATHYLYLRADAPKTHTPDTPRSIFVSNVPIDSSEAGLRALFKQVDGALVERVEFEGDKPRETRILVKGKSWEEGEQKGKKRKREEEMNLGEEYALPETWTLNTRKSGSSAVVVFVDRTTAEKVLKECRRVVKKGKKLDWIQTEVLGIKRYKEHHALTYPPRAELKQKVNAYLAHYAALEETRSKKLKLLRSVPDEDGFITVTRGGRTGPAKIEEAQAAAERLKEREKKRVGGAFYRFQTRENAKKKERELQDRFEADAKKLREIRERRGKIRPE